MNPYPGPMFPQQGPAPRPAPPRPDTGRRIAGALAIGLCLLVALIGIVGAAGGGNLLAPALMKLSGEIGGSPVKHASGREAPYELTFPNDRWYLRDQAVASRDNALADRWFVRPDLDAHIVVIAEPLPNQMSSIEAYTEAIITNLEKGADQAHVRYRAPWPAFPERGRLLEAEGMKNQLALEWHYALVTAYGWSFQLVGFASKSTMGAVKEEMRAIFDSLKLPESIVSAVPPELEPAPARAVRGALLPYTITAPNDFWHLRKAEIVKKDNPLIDRWVSRPELDAHVLIVAEQADPGQTVILSAYVEQVLTNARKNASRFEVVKREPWDKFPNDGERLRVSLSRNGVDFEYDYGLYTKGRAAFQIAGFTSKKGFAAVEEDISRVVGSFEPPAQGQP